MYRSFCFTHLVHALRNFPPPVLPLLKGVYGIIEEEYTLDFRRFFMSVVEKNKAFDNALASMEMEGFTYSAHEMKIAEDFCRGHISREEILQMIKEKKA